MLSTKIVLLITLILIGFTSVSQTILNPSDLVIIAFKTSGSSNGGRDAIKILTLVDLDCGTTFIVTDNNWNAATGDWFCNNDEFGIEVTITQLTTAGSVILIDTADPPRPAPIIVQGVGAATDIGLGNPWGTNYGLNSEGDNCFLLQGTRNAPSFIFGLRNSGTFASGGSCDSKNNTGLPPALTLGFSAIQGVSANRWHYNCSSLNSGTTAALISAILTPSNWNSISNNDWDVNNNYNGLCTFTVTDAVPLVICGGCFSEITGDLVVCAGSTTQLTGSGTPNATSPWTSSNTAVATVNSSGLVTGISAGSATITYLDNVDCPATAVVTVNPLPVIGGATQVCAGLTANVTPGTGGTWTSSNTGVATITNAGVVTGVTAGTSTLTFTNTTTGCINTVLFTVNPIYNQTEVATICTGDSFIFGTQTLTTAGVYTETFIAVTGCDSIVELTLSVDTSFNETDAVAICDGASYLFGAQNLTVGGVYIETFTSVTGCDSIVELTLTVNPIYNETTAATICNGASYIFGTQTLTTLGVYAETFTSVSGCDSIVELTLTVTPIVNETDAATICDGDSYIFGTQTLTASGVFTETFTAVSGCDSIVELTLTVTPIVNETDTATICDGDSYIFGTQTLTASGVFTETFTAVSGCDSIVELTLTVNSTYNETDEATICDGNSYIFGNQTLTTSGVYTETFTAVTGCDSIVELTLSVVSSFNETDVATICDGDNYTFGTQTLITTGVYTETFISLTGCDSLVELTLTVNPIYNETAAATICNGASYIFGTQTLTTLGVYTETFTSVSGCDSIVELTLTVNASYNETESAAICEGDSYTFGTQSLTASGVYSETFMALSGCDSIVELTLTVNPLPSIDAGTDLTICSGGSATLQVTGGADYLWDNGLGAGDSHFVSPGSTTLYTVNGVDVNGCENSDQVTVFVESPPTIDAILTDVSCFGFTDGNINLTPNGNGPFVFTWTPNVSTTNNATNLNAGTYTVEVEDGNGCVSNASFTLVEPDEITYTVSSVNSDCSVDNGSATINVSGGSGSYTYTWSPAAGNTATLSNIGAGDYEVTIEDGNGCSASAVVTVNQVNTPNLTLVNIQNVSCFGLSDGSIEALVTGGTPGYTYNWSPNVGNNPLADNLSSGMYLVSVTDAAGCIAVDSVFIAEPTQLTGNAQTQPAQCGLSNGEIIFDVNGGVPSYLFSWSNGDTSASIDGLTSGNYSVVVTDANGCTYEDMITVGFDNTFGIQVFPNPVIITLGESTQLLSAVNPDSPNLSYTWTPSEGLSCSDCPNPIATPTVTTTYTLTVSSTDGCQAETSVTVFVELPCTAVSVPTIFSPNGDGLNDAFCVLGNCIQQIDLSIYNRWGEVVFQSGSLNDCWDGTYRGEPMNSAVFVYKLRAVKDDGEEVLLTGNITVVR